MTELERRAIPACAPCECFEAATFAEAVLFAAIELDLIAEGQEAAEHYNRRQVASLRRFVDDNRASLGSLR